MPTSCALAGYSSRKTTRDSLCEGGRASLPRDLPEHAGVYVAAGGEGFEEGSQGIAARPVGLVRVLPAPDLELRARSSPSRGSPNANRALVRALRGGPHFAWNNLIGVCSGRSGPSPVEPEGSGLSDHCDRRRRDEPLFLNPIGPSSPNPVDYLKYSLTGEVSADDERAAKDLRTLNMNCTPLVRARGAVMDAVRGHLSSAGRTVSSLSDLEAKRSLVSGGNPPQYSMMVLYFVEKWHRRAELAESARSRKRTRARKRTRR